VGNPLTLLKGIERILPSDAQNKEKQGRKNLRGFARVKAGNLQKKGPRGSATGIGKGLLVT